MMTLDDGTADRLVLLRSLFDSARNRAQDSTTVGRHAALVLLDGACELGLRHAADHLGVRARGQESFESLYEKVRAQTLANGSVDGWTGVRLMHRARNSVQHEGILPDADQLARWVADSERFLACLVSMVFHTRLSEVHRAHVVAMPLLREQLAQAEISLETGDALDSVCTALAALDAARARWRRQRESLGLSRPGSGMLNPFADTMVELSVRQLDDLIEMEPFAPDMGEYLWLVGLRRSLGAPPPTIADAQRVLVFVFEWILRWEAFSSRYDSGRAERWRRELRPPTSSEPELGARLVKSADVQVTGPRGPGMKPFVNVVLQLVDAPTQDFEPWLADLQSELLDSWKRLMISETYVYPNVDRSGQVRFPTTRPDMDATSVVALVRGAIVAANRRAVARSEGGEDVLAAHRAAISQLVDPDNCAMFGEVQQAFEDGTDTSPTALRAVIEIEPRADLSDLVREPMFAYLVQTAINSGRVRILDADPPVIRVDRSVAPDRLAEALKSALEAARGQFASEAEDLARREATRIDVTRRFLDAL